MIFYCSGCKSPLKQDGCCPAGRFCNLPGRWSLLYWKLWGLLFATRWKPWTPELGKQHPKVYCYKSFDGWVHGQYPGQVCDRFDVGRLYLEPLTVIERIVGVSK